MSSSDGEEDIPGAFQTPEATPARNRSELNLTPQTQAAAPLSSNTSNPNNHESLLSTYISPIITMGESLAISSHLKLKGAHNYSDWRQAIEAAVEGHSLGRWLRKKAKVPDQVDEDDEKADAEKLKIWLEWKAGDGKTKLLIMNSILAEPSSVIKGKTTALAMWEALEHQYHGTGEVLLWSCIENYCRIDFDQYNDITKYRSAFNDARSRLENLKKTDIKDWHSIIYVMGLSKEYPEWAQRQRAALRSKTPPTLEAIMEDLIDESRVQEASETAFYGGKPNPRDKKKKIEYKKHDKQDDKKPYRCSACKSNGHSTDNCLNTNKKKRKEWEEKTGRKWLTKEEYAKKNNKGGSDSKKKERKSAESDDDDTGFALCATQLESVESDNDDIVFALCATQLETALPAHRSIIHHNDFLADSGATVHITYDRSRFEDDYTEEGVFLPVKTMGGAVQPLGRGTVILRCPLANGKIKLLTLLNTLYVPNGGINLFSGRKLLQKGGVIRNNDLLDPQGN